MPETPQEIAARAAAILLDARNHGTASLAAVGLLSDYVHDLADDLDDANAEVAELAGDVADLAKENAETSGHLDEARDLAKALWSALHEAADDMGAIARIDPDLDVDVRLPYWLTDVAGAPETWQRDTDGGN